MKLTYEKYVPVRATKGAAGVDVRAAEDVPLAPGDTVLAPTGVKVQIKEGHVGLLFGRSSLATKYGINLINGVGVIDADYRGEVKVPLHNTGNSLIVLKEGDRIGQLVEVPCVMGEPEIVEKLDETERGEGGFGSTGR